MSERLVWVCACPSCGRGGEPQHFVADGIVTPGVTAAAAFSTAQVAHQLRTQWGGSFEGKFIAWDKPVISFSIGDGAAGNPTTPSEMSGLAGMTLLMQSRASLAFALWDDLVPLTLRESQSPGSDITFNMSANTGNATYSASGMLNVLDGNTFGLAKPQIWLASQWASHNSDGAMGFGGYGFMTYLHEVGHALGLSHPGTYNAAPGVTVTYAGFAEYAQDTRRFSVMSYFDANADGSGTDHVGSGGVTVFAQTPMVHDVLAIQAAYGASTQTRLGDTTYGFNNTSGRAVFDFRTNPDPVVTLFDSGGADTIDLSGYTRGNRIDLTPGAYSDVGGFMTNNLGIAFGTVIEAAIGGSGNDSITGNGWNNVLKGNGGNDALVGGGGFDTAVYDGAFLSYTVTELPPAAGGLRTRVSGAADGADTLAEIERLQFSDGVVLLADGRAGFDSLFYAVTYQDVFRAQIAPIDHYMANGWREGRDPSAVFSTGGYLRANPDVAGAGLNPLLHYETNGWREGRDPNANFDTAGYLALHRDVAAAGMNPLDHWMEAGRFEGRVAPKMVGSVDAHGFDAQFYLMKNADVAAAGVDPATHFYASGWREGRAASNYFDTAGYLATYGDVRNAGINPLLHYAVNGWREGRDPSAAFDTGLYKAIYGDVAAAGLNPLLHFMANGIVEGRVASNDGLFG